MALLKSFLFAGILVVAAHQAVWAQQVGGSDGKDFDPVTRALSSKNPPPDDPGQAGAPAQQLTPEQLAEQERQKQLAQIQAMKDEARKKHEEAEKARKEKLELAKEAEMKKMAELKAEREDRMKQIKDNREQMVALQKEEKDARKAYEDARKNATGDSVHQIEDDYRKAEADRKKKMNELRHYHYVKPKDNQTPQQIPVGTTALPGTITSGSGANVTIH